MRVNPIKIFEEAGIKMKTPTTAVEALEEIEALSSDDFMEGEFLCGELPEDYKDRWIMRTKEIARKALKEEQGDADGLDDGRQDAFRND